MLFLILSMLFFVNTPLLAFEQKKKLEYGIGLITLKVNHYRGANQKREWFIPLPYFSYKSENVEAEPSYIRGTFYKREKFSLKLSVIVGPSVESKKNHARFNMRNLGFTLEAGPMGLYKLWKSTNGKRELTFQLPVRQVFETNLKNSFRTVGIFTIPFLNYALHPHKTKWGIGHDISFGPMFATRRYHSIFYDVSDVDQTINRKKYTSKGGYSGTQLTVLLNKRWNRLAMVPFSRFDYLKGAVFEDSPLYKKNSYFSFGLGLFYFIN